MKALIIIIAIVLSIPIVAVVAGMAEDPFKRKRNQRLRITIKEEWIPNKRYAYLFMESDSPLGQYITINIVPKYENHVILDSYDSKTHQHSSSWQDDDDRVLGISRDIFSDYDGQTSVQSATVSKSSEYFNEDRMYDFYRLDYFREENLDKVGYLGDEISIKQAGKMIEDAIKACLNEWGINLKS